MKKYPKMKPSGVEWIGDVPEGWEVKRIKYVAAIFGRIGFRGYTVNDIVDEGQGVITLSPGNIKNDILTLESATYLSFEKYYESPEIMIFPEDIVLVKTGSTIGKTAFIPEKAPNMTLNPQLVVFKELKVSPKFIYYQTTCPFFKSMFDVEQTGGTTPTISQEKINSFSVVVPPEITNQTAIAAYLDRKTAQIDQSIAEKERLIELFREERQAIINHAVTKGIRPGVKMKPSGVEWIGDVPEGWAVKRLKHIAAIFGRIGFRGYTVNDIVEEGQGVITLSPGNIKNDILTLESATYLSFEKYYESPEIMIFPEDIVLVKTGSTIGKTAIIPQNVPEMTLNPQLVVLKDLKALSKFLYYQTTCPFFKNMFEVEQTGGTTPTISQEKINSFPVVVPSQIEEQKEVVNFIDQKTSQIDTAISGIRQEIALLQEYRQALIFEAVTGKIDVRDYA